MNLKSIFARHSALLLVVWLTLAGGLVSGCAPGELREFTQNLTKEKVEIMETEDAPLVSISQGTPIEGQYIIAYKEGTFTADDPESRKKGWDRSLGIEPVESRLQYTSELRTKVERTVSKYQIASADIQNVITGIGIEAVVAHLDEKSLEEIRQDPDVEYVEEDRLFTMSTIEPATRRPMIPSSWGMSFQIPGYGVSRVGGAVDKTNSQTWAWIIDTGIELNHPDLNVNATYSKNFCFGPNRATNMSGNDGHGHGTHVAGIIGAKDNGFGILGVAAGVPVVSVKVIEDNGTGSLSSLLFGLAWVRYFGIPGDVANLSIGSDASTSIDRAVSKLGKKGIIVTMAAGNDAADANNYSPARLNAPNVYTIASFGVTDNHSSFSNYGSCIDYAAPGCGIISCALNGMYCFLSGTSMAAPHAAGVLLITGNPTTDGYSTADPDGGDPIITH